LLQVKNVRYLALYIGLAFSLAACAHLGATGPQSGKAYARNPYFYIIAARYAQDNGNFRDALKFYSHIDSPYTWLASARIHYVIGENEKALSFVNKVLKQDKSQDQALELRAEIYAREKQWSNAIEDAEKVFENHPDNKALGLFLASLKMCISDFNGAKELLNNLLDRFNDDPQVLYTLSKACLGNGDFIGAKQDLIKVIKAQPDFPQAYVDLGRVYHTLGDISGEERTYNAFLNVFPRSKDGYILLSNFYITQKRYRDALKVMRGLMKIGPSEGARRKLMLLELEQGEFTEVLELLHAKKHLTDEDKYYIAVAYSGLNKWNDALKALPSPHPGGKLACEIIILKSTILDTMGERENAIKVLQDSWKDYTSCKELGYKLANLLESSGRRERGLEVAMDILKRSPDDPIALNFVGYVWADSGVKLDKAQDMISTALKARPKDCFILDSMAWVLFKRHKTKKALEYMEKAIRKCSEDPMLNEHMGDILSALGNKSGAMDYYLKARVNKKKDSLKLDSKINTLLEHFNCVNSTNQAGDRSFHEQ